MPGNNEGAADGSTEAGNEEGLADGNPERDDREGVPHGGHTGAVAGGVVDGSP